MLVIFRLFLPFLTSSYLFLLFLPFLTYLVTKQVRKPFFYILPVYMDRLLSGDILLAIFLRPHVYGFVNVSLMYTVKVHISVVLECCTVHYCTLQSVHYMVMPVSIVTFKYDKGPNVGSK